MKSTLLNQTETPQASCAAPRIAVLLCTFNGEKFLSQQLDSIFGQRHKNLKLWVSDDGSKDRTLEILRAYQSRFKNQLTILSGPQKGHTQNFISLIRNPNIEADYFSFADQDDVWKSDKLSRAIVNLQRTPDNQPSLYCSRTCLIDEQGREIGLSPLFNKDTVGFANALVQNIGGGNTMVMNQNARQLMLAMGQSPVVIHDWWAYMLVSGAGGTVIYDPYPTVRYRQHVDNLIGSNIGFYNRMLRLLLILKGRFREWNTVNTEALCELSHLLTSENKTILNEFCAARNRWLIPRLRGIVRSGIYRQTPLANCALALAAFLKKL